MFCMVCGNEAKDQFKFCIKCGSEIRGSQIKKYNLPLKSRRLIIFGFLSLIIATFIFFYHTKRFIGQTNQDIASAVVNIYCKGASEEGASGGSGTIFSEDGLVLTNAHIIPKDYIQGESNCVVILPDPTNGSPKEMYTAYPIIIPKLSEQYDLAFVQIHDVYYDQEKGESYGDYPKKFPSYAGKECKGDIRLGESIRIYGYPALSGGYALTVTDGIVSSLLPEEGYIVTSAKISHGNSGGLAVDENNCMVGVPSMVSSDENESLGVIISNDSIYKFADEVQSMLKN